MRDKKHKANKFFGTLCLLGLVLYFISGLYWCYSEELGVPIGEIEHVIILNGVHTVDIDEVRQVLDKTKYFIERIPGTTILIVKEKIYKEDTIKLLRSISFEELMAQLSEKRNRIPFDEIPFEERFYFSKVDVTKTEITRNVTGKYEQCIRFQFSDINDVTLKSLIYLFNHKYVYTDILHKLNVKDIQTCKRLIKTFQENVEIEMVSNSTIEIKVRGEEPELVEMVSNEFIQKIKYFIEPNIGTPFLGVLECYKGFDSDGNLICY
jgi:hypothetical protein